MKKIIYILVFIAAIASLSSCTIEEIQQAEEAQSTVKDTTTIRTSEVDPQIQPPR